MRAHEAKPGDVIKVAATTGTVVKVIHKVYIQIADAKGELRSVLYDSDKELERLDKQEKLI